MATPRIDLSSVNVGELFSAAPTIDTPTPQPDATAPEPASVTDPAETLTEPDAAATDPGTPEGGAPAAPADDTDTGADSAPSLVEEVRSLLGYEVEGEFEDSETGLVALTKAVGQRIAQQQLEGVFAQLPDVQEYLNYRMQGGDPRRYFEAAAPEVDYNTLTVGDTDITLQRSLVSQMLTAQGLDADTIGTLLDGYEDANLLKRQADVARTILAKGQEKTKADRIAEQARIAQEQQAAQQAQWQTVQDTITRGNLAGVIIPEAEKTAFFEWMAKPVNDKGQSQRMVQRETMTTDQALMLEFLLYKGLDFGKLVKSVQTTTKVSSLRDRLKNSSTSAPDRMKAGDSGTSRSTSLPSFSDLL